MLLETAAARILLSVLVTIRRRVRNKACVLFRKKITKAVVEALGGTVTLSDNLTNSVKKKGSKVESSSPRSKGEYRQDQGQSQ